MGWVDDVAREGKKMMQIVSLKSDWRFHCLTCIIRILIDDDSTESCNACYDCARTVFLCGKRHGFFIIVFLFFFCSIQFGLVMHRYSHTHSLFTKSDLCSFLCVENEISLDTFLFLSRYFTRHMSNIRRGYR